MGKRRCSSEHFTVHARKDEMEPQEKSGDTI